MYSSMNLCIYSSEVRRHLNEKMLMAVTIHNGLSMRDCFSSPKCMIISTFLISSCQEIYWAVSWSNFYNNLPTTCACLALFPLNHEDNSDKYMKQNSKKSKSIQIIFISFIIWSWKSITAPIGVIAKETVLITSKRKILIGKAKNELQRLHLSKNVLLVLLMEALLTKQESMPKYIEYIMHNSSVPHYASSYNKINVTSKLLVSCLCWFLLYDNSWLEYDYFLNKLIV
jgi:hypothetical protein